MRENAVIILLAAVIFPLSSCDYGDGDSLLRLPEPPAGAEKLNALLEPLFEDGASFAPPGGGENRQPRQSAELLGGGDREILAFLTFPDGIARIAVYAPRGGSYYELDRLDEGAFEVESVAYADLTGDGLTDMVVGWVGGSGLRVKFLTAYSWGGGSLTRLYSAPYEHYEVFDSANSGKSDVAAVTLNENGGACTLYYVVGGEVRVSENAPMSRGAEKPLRACVNRLSDGVPALYLTSRTGDGSIVTDVFARVNGRFLNTALNQGTGISYSHVYGGDIIFPYDADGDGTLDLPEVSQRRAGFSVTSWYDRDSAGKTVKVADTYYDKDGGWYLILPRVWLGTLTVAERSEEDGVKGAVFAFVIGGEERPVFAVSVFDKAPDKTPEGYVELARTGGKLYAAEIPRDSTVSEYEIKGMFRVIENRGFSGDL